MTGFSMENKSMKRAPNVLIIFPDQLRRYAAGYWSNSPYREHVIGEPDPVVTPNIDELASGGLVFTNAISNSPVCSPHRGMLLSGMYPEKNGLTTNCHKSKAVGLKQDVVAITDVFHGAGYNTAYFGKCHWVRTDPVFDQKDSYVGSNVKPGGRYINS
ncbi:MAG: sulfatase-like hydrolase/transferase, partial [Verrucomicrobia bacterium]|nr:sulfatase-like hydrolase/transferase [Verrucomicrobiota bacterium]